MNVVSQLAMEADVYQRVKHKDTWFLDWECETIKESKKLNFENTRKKFHSGNISYEMDGIYPG